MTLKSSPIISVIMGVYNDSIFLEEAIQSILNQTFSDFEFIICNDCSTESKVEDILKKYAKIDNRIIIINNQVNSGLAKSLNKCLSIAKGKYIARMDSDDRSLPNRFEVEKNFLDNHKSVAVCGSQTFYINNEGVRYKKSEIDKPIIIDFDYAVKKSCLIHPTVMMRKSALNQVNGYTVNENTLRAEDYDLWCKLTYCGYKLINLPDILFEYREDLSAFKKRKYKYRIQECRIKYYWLNKSKLSIFKYFYAIRPLIIGLIPSIIMKKIKGN